VDDIFIGNDLVEVSRIEKSINSLGKKFLDRIYTEVEQHYCQSKPHPSIHFAGRFAAKEAIIKAMQSSGYNKPIPFSSIAIHSGKNGEPIVFLDFTCNGKCKLTISHTDKYAIASAIYIKK
tara:strand:+ start:501 stop:863 length:363 start_codon:yes stop_codon:yes gene_type:complete